MNHEDKIIAKIKAELANSQRELQSEEGLLRLQEVLEKYNGEYRLIWSDEIIRKLKEEPLRPNFTTGIKQFDEITGGFREQQVISISAHTKHGKTAFGIFLMEKLEALKPVLIALEQSPTEIAYQRMTNKQYLPRFLSPELNAARVDTEWIEHRVVEGIAKYGTKMVVIDHLGYLEDTGRGGDYKRENLAYRIQRLMQELKNIAKRWNVVIFILCHISQKDESNPPTLEDIKGSSGIAQESDKILLLWVKNRLKNKVRVYSNKVLLSVAANRQTGTRGYIGLIFDKVKGTYTEDNSWVDSLMRSAEASSAVDDEFDAL